MDVIALGKSVSELSYDELFKITAFAVQKASLSTLKEGGMKSVPDME